MLCRFRRTKQFIDSCSTSRVRRSKVSPLFLHHPLVVIGRHKDQGEQTAFTNFLPYICLQNYPVWSATRQKNLSLSPFLPFVKRNLSLLLAVFFDFLYTIQLCSCDSNCRGVANCGNGWKVLSCNGPYASAHEAKRFCCGFENGWIHIRYTLPITHYVICIKKPHWFVNPTPQRAFLVSFIFPWK